jgi:hypothetical protein
MAHIEEIRFDHVGKAEGCMCDHCGAWITNIWTVKFREGEYLHFGTDCFDKRIKGKLNAFGKKEMQKAMKRIQEHSELLNQLKQDEVTETIQKEWDSYRYWQDYWKDKTFEEWKAWMIEEVLPDRLEADKKALAKFEKINF